MSIIVKPECRCCDCKNLGVIFESGRVVCEGPLPAVWEEAANGAGIEMDLTAAEVLEIRRCDCFEPRVQ